jgi:two-component system sensor histidine kinase/response regulator
MRDPWARTRQTGHSCPDAIKFTERGDVLVGIAIDSEREEIGSLHFWVSDTGIGIPVEKQALIFVPFTQAD